MLRTSECEHLSNAVRSVPRHTVHTLQTELQAAQLYCELFETQSCRVTYDVRNIKQSEVIFEGFAQPRHGLHDNLQAVWSIGAGIQGTPPSNA